MPPVETCAQLISVTVHTATTAMSGTTPTDHPTPGSTIWLVAKASPPSDAMKMPKPVASAASAPVVATKKRVQP